MVDDATVDLFFSKVSTKLGVTMIRGNQLTAGVEAVQYPYGTYLIINEEEWHRHSTEVVADGLDAKIVEDKMSEGYISVNFMDRDGTDEPRRLAREFIKFVDSREYRHTESPLYDVIFEGFIVDTPNKKIDDRSYFLDGTEYEYKMGIDVQFRAIETVETPIAAIEQIEVDANGDQIILK